MASENEVAAVLPAHARVEQTLDTIRRLAACVPPPAEILVHVDAGGHGCAEAIAREFPEVGLIRSSTNVGPGGGRNRLLSRAGCELIASFDDDSYPVDENYFARVVGIAAEWPEAAVFAADVVHRGSRHDAPPRSSRPVADFIGCGCVYRKSRFEKTNGYVPLPYAYGMEESDLALQLHAQGEQIIYAPSLRVYHDTLLNHHSSPAVSAHSIANLALLAFLRYPIVLWPLGLMQVLIRVLWLVRHRRFSGLLKGILMIPRHCLQHVALRQPIHRQAVLSFLKLRRTQGAE